MEIKGVHPVADIFPMMSEDELADLAADIKANGLLLPIIVDDNGILIDGRNRIRACEIAGVEPRFEGLNGRDATALIVSTNIRRRHLSAGQSAILLAKAYPEDGGKGGRGKKSEATNSAESAGFSTRRLREAREIVRYAPELADQVLSREITYEDARLKVRQRKAEALTNEEKMTRLRQEAPDLAELSGMSLDEAIVKLDQRKADEAKLALIRESAPDLVALVEEGRMSVMDALAAQDKREQLARQEQEAATSVLATIMRMLNTGNNGKEIGERLMSKFNPHLWPADELGDPTPEFFEMGAEALRTCARLRRKQEH